MAKKASKSEDIPAPPEGLTQEEAKSVSKRRPLRAAVVYEIIRTEGEGELARTFGALWWSGLAAGISIGFSVLSQAMLAASLAGSPGSTVIANVGYSVGFLIVILSRQQLFTENTLTAVLPVIASRDWRWFWDFCGGIFTDLMVLVLGFGQALDNRTCRQSGRLPTV